jgi:CO/xanthine dehydrogenase FAD-binding subunit
VSLNGVTDYMRPKSVEEAFSVIGTSTRPIGGGTDVILHAPPTVTGLVDLSGLRLDYIREGDGFRVGATATLTAMEEHPGLRAHLGGVLPEMLRHVGSPLLRNVATIGGHLARGRLSDVVPVLLALDATISCYDGISRTISLEDFYRARIHETRMLITEIGLPPAADRSSAGFVKLSRTFFDLAMLNCACRADLDEERRVSSARVVVGETPALAAPVPSAADALVGSTLRDADIAAAAAAAVAAVEFGSDSRASADYRRDLCRVAVTRCLGKVRDRLGGAR